MMEYVEWNPRNGQESNSDISDAEWPGSWPTGPWQDMDCPILIADAHVHSGYIWYVKRHVTCGFPEIGVPPNHPFLIHSCRIFHDFPLWTIHFFGGGEKSGSPWIFFQSDAWSPLTSSSVTASILPRITASGASRCLELAPFGGVHLVKNGGFTSEMEVSPLKNGEFHGSMDQWINGSMDQWISSPPRWFPASFPTNQLQVIWVLRPPPPWHTSLVCSLTSIPSHPPRLVLENRAETIRNYPLVNKHSYWKWPFIVDFPIEHGDFP